jgi:aminomethyltransferase
MMTPRDLSNMKVGQCKYVILVNQNGGVLNDPILLKVSEDKYWFSLADSDILFWAQGLSANGGYNVEISEPDVSPLQLQGPKSRDIMIKIFGEQISDLKYYWFKEFRFDNTELIISRTGWSSELGYEIFLTDSKVGNELYEHIMKVGEPMGLKPGHTSTIRRIEGGMLSYHADMTINTNPLELGMDKFIDLNNDFDFIGKDALIKIKNDGIKRKQVGLYLDNKRMDRPNTRFWSLRCDNKVVGEITSAVYSPRLEKNIALAIVDINYSNLNQKLIVDDGNSEFNAVVVNKPFYDPNKNLTKS